jgi:hypothetical protein
MHHLRAKASPSSLHSPPEAADTSAQGDAPLALAELLRTGTRAGGTTSCEKTDSCHSDCIVLFAALRVRTMGKAIAFIKRAAVH